MNMKRNFGAAVAVFAGVAMAGVWMQTRAAAGEDGNWPSFRGAHAAGVADKQRLPEKWDGAKGENIAWRAEIPGLAHSSPVVWGNRVFVTTAVSSAGQATFKPGLYGAGTASEDQSVQQWKVLALDKRTGKLLWEATAYEGTPREKRHIKATYANATPATDGRYVVAFFGSQGLHAFTMDGKKVWSADLGRLDVGAYDAPDYEWGTASSPIIHKNLVIVQCDTQKEDFLVALDIRSGKEVWRAKREELPSWGTPTVYPGKARTELITNASNYVRSYDPATGKELWRLGPTSQITAPTPVYQGDLIVVASGRRPTKPIYVIRAGANGDISLAGEATSNEHVVWSVKGRGSYMPTPLIYGEYLYVLNNDGVFDCYELRSGKEVYRQRIPHQGSGFSGSPVAADGKIYLPSEDGDMFVIRAGAQFEVLARNPIGELLMSTPALSEGTMFVRAERHLYAIRAGK